MERKRTSEQEDRQKDSYTDRKAGTQKDINAGNRKKTGRQQKADRQSGKHIDREIDSRQTDRWTGA